MDYINILENIHSPNSYGFVAALLTTIAFLPQLVRIWKTKSANDVSISMLILFNIGVALWIIYGIKSHSIPVIIANLFTLTLNLIILGLKMVYSKNADQTL